MSRPWWVAMLSAASASNAPFPRYPGRQVVELAGPWDFAYLGDAPLPLDVLARRLREEELHKGRRHAPDAFTARDWLCPLESCPQWTTHPCHRCCAGDGIACRGSDDCCDVGLGRRGVAAYRTFIERQVGLLYFRGCGLHCMVLLDRVKLVEHHGSYSPFWADLAAGSATQGLAKRATWLVLIRAWDYVEWGG
eukprot:Skav215898  [mRNA]  locus=scaffold1542:50809:63228:- [translate_table: standard]